MSGNTFGKLFKITTFGESHGAGLGVVIDGIPSNIKIDEAKIQAALDRRRPGQSSKSGDNAAVTNRNPSLQPSGWNCQVFLLKYNPRGGLYLLRAERPFI